MADKSKAGWKIVEEYLTEEVAFGPKDDKQIRKYEKRTMERIAMEKEKKKSTKGSYSMAPERFRNASHHKPTSASGEERKDTGRKITGHTRGKKVIEEKTAVEVFKDKYFHNSLLISQNLLIGVEDDNVVKHVKSQQSVVGRLTENVRAWEDMGASDFILETIRTGYKIPFIETPSLQNLKITGLHYAMVRSWKQLLMNCSNTVE